MGVNWHQQLKGAVRLEQLAVPRKSLWERCEAEKAQREAAQLQGCTFKPSVHRKPPSGNLSAQRQH